jgi:hypothetical protein
MRLHPVLIGTLVLALFAGGCGGRSQKLVKVKGKVLMQGAPLANAGVTFIPENGVLPEPTGITKSDGSFELMTYSPGDGAPPGDYRVIVEKVEERVVETPKTGPPDPNNPASAKDLYVSMMAPKKKREKAKSLVHPAYSDRARTFLRCRVPPDGPVVFEVDK